MNETSDRSVNIEVISERLNSLSKNFDDFSRDVRGLLEKFLDGIGDVKVLETRVAQLETTTADLTTRLNNKSKTIDELHTEVAVNRGKIGSGERFFWILLTAGAAVIGNFMKVGL